MLRGARKLLFSNIMEQPSIKKTKTFDLGTITSKIPTIGTHNGTFHCDEVLACYMLKTLPEFENAIIKRSRDPAVLDSCDIVVDVGGVYDLEKLRFDHHQRSFSDTFDDSHKTKLSSAGLVYKHFGRSIVANLLGLSVEDSKSEIVYQKVYDEFVEAIDGVDNGVNRYPKDVKSAYQDHTSLSARIGRLNPLWCSPTKGPDVEMEAFERAMLVAGPEFVSYVEYIGKGWLPARQLVVDALAGRMSLDSSGSIIKLSTGGPWKSHLVELEKEQGLGDTIKYALFPDNAGNWRIQAVPLEEGSFDLRLGLPEEWRGHRDDELSKITGVEGCIFVHMNGFIGGAKTYEGALELARKALSIGGKKE